MSNAMDRQLDIAEGTANGYDAYDAKGPQVKIFDDIWGSLETNKESNSYQVLDGMGHSFKAACTHCPHTHKIC